MNELKLPKKPTIQDYQSYVSDMKRQRGFNVEDARIECFYLVEEIGELFKAIRKGTKNARIDKASESFCVAEELADVLIYLCSIANIVGVDLEKAFREKEEINKRRIWETLNTEASQEGH